MGYLFKEYIEEKIVEEKFRDRYGKKYKLKNEMQYQFEFNRIKMDVGFTEDLKAYWIFKYKGDYYMKIMEEIELKDKYSVLDIYTTLMENAVATYKHRAGLLKARKKALEERGK